uniref:Immunoglobulin subtype domain-containing protein n=1 Tax=Cyprinodon variegatus TaxID=28743 RepID=A0A3Q2E416_CYPVA
MLNFVFSLCSSVLCADGISGKEAFAKLDLSIYISDYQKPSEPSVKGKYQGRASFFKQNFSVVISNVQHEDSGNYIATATGDKEKNVADYRVIVQVSPVKLTVNSSDTQYCNFTATCKVVDSKVGGIYQCDNQTCRALSKPDVKDSLLTVYVQEGSVVCNHRNNVSWTDDTQPLSGDAKLVALNSVTPPTRHRLTAALPRGETAILRHRSSDYHQEVVCTLSAEIRTI